jgi:hypothetical protein
MLQGERAVRELADPDQGHSFVVVPRLRCPTTHHVQRVSGFVHDFSRAIVGIGYFTGSAETAYRAKALQKRS